MESKTTNQTKARLLVLVVFVIGFAVGALSMNLYKSRPGSETPRGERHGGNPEVRIVEKMNKRLSLTEDQQQQIGAILRETFAEYKATRDLMQPKVNEFIPRFDATRQKGRERMRAVLKPEQLPEFEKMIAERDREREEEKQRDRK
jgi:Spy/CpxP family protein refolding chaperone